jgi:hypothetical protein
VGAEADTLDGGADPPEFQDVTGSASPLDLNVSEDDLLSVIVEYAHLRGWLVNHIRNSRAGVTQGDSGVPDLQMVRDRVVWAELKDQRKERSVAQLRWRDALLKAGAEYHLWRPSDWRTGFIEGVLK